jgi:hypothetical protein
MKRIALLLAIVFLAVKISAQITDTEKDLRTKPAPDTLSGWKKGGIINLNFSQTSLSNWSAGGESSIAANGVVSLFANWKKKDASSWDNSLNIGYGTMKTSSNKPFIKTDDRIEINSKYGREITKKLYYAGFFSFKTQMTTGYNYIGDTAKKKISNLLAPGYVIIAIGLDYKPSANIGIFAAPITGRLTIVADTALSNAGAFGVDKGSSSRTEFGGYLRLTYKLDIMQNISLHTEADFFSNYLKNPTNIVVNWQALISMKINKFIAATIGTTLIYDDAIKYKDPINPTTYHGPRIQFKEVLAIGFSHKF